MDKSDKLKDKLQKLFIEYELDDVEDAIEQVKKFIYSPILTIKCSRTESNIEINECNSDEIRHVATLLIAHVLEMFPKDWRNDILCQSIQQINDIHDEGTLFTEHEE